MIHRFQVNVYTDGQCIKGMFVDSNKKGLMSIRKTGTDACVACDVLPEGVEISAQVRGGKIQVKMDRQFKLYKAQDNTPADTWAFLGDCGMFAFYHDSKYMMVEILSVEQEEARGAAEGAAAPKKVRTDKGAAAAPQEGKTVAELEKEIERLTRSLDKAQSKNQALREKLQKKDDAMEPLIKAAVKEARDEWEKQRSTNIKQLNRRLVEKDGEISTLTSEKQVMTQRKNEAEKQRDAAILEVKQMKKDFIDRAKNSLLRAICRLQQENVEYIRLFTFAYNMWVLSSAKCIEYSSLISSKKREQKDTVDKRFEFLDTVQEQMNQKYFDGVSVKNEAPENPIVREVLDLAFGEDEEDSDSMEQKDDSVRFGKFTPPDEGEAGENWLQTALRNVMDKQGNLNPRILSAKTAFEFLSVGDALVISECPVMPEQFDWSKFIQGHIHQTWENIVDAVIQAAEGDTRQLQTTIEFMKAHKHIDFGWICDPTRKKMKDVITIDDTDSNSQDALRAWEEAFLEKKKIFVPFMGWTSKTVDGKFTYDFPSQEEMEAKGLHKLALPSGFDMYANADRIKELQDEYNWVVSIDDQGRYSVRFPTDDEIKQNNLVAIAIPSVDLIRYQKAPGIPAPNDAEGAAAPKKADDAEGDAKKADDGVPPPPNPDAGVPPPPPPPADEESGGDNLFEEMIGGKPAGELEMLADAAGKAADDWPAGGVEGDTHPLS